MSFLRKALYTAYRSQSHIISWRVLSHSSSLIAIRKERRRSSKDYAANATLMSGLIAVVGCTTCALVTKCDSESEENAPTPQRRENPLWPSGVPAEMVNRYVEEILSSPGINIASIPDSVERLIYVSTVRLTLNSVYESLSVLHGQEVLGHRIELTKIPSTKALDLKHSSGKIDEKALDHLAERLLQNKAVNQRWLPDYIERQVYANCLKLVFSLLDKVADTLCIRLCGHQLSLSFEPLSADDVKVGGHKMDIDLAILDMLVQETIAESKGVDSGSSVLSYLPFYEGFIRDLHKTLYSLILGILGDMLSSTELAVLEERLQVRMVPMDKETWRPQTDETKDAAANKDELLRQLHEELKSAHKSEARARNIAAVGLSTAALVIVAVILQLEG